MDGEIRAVPTRPGSGANNGWDSNPARADDGWDNPTSANNGWNSNSASLEDGWGNSTSASNDLRSNSARVDDGWGNSTSVNSGWSSNSPAANDSWGKSTSADRSWGNSAATAESGWGNSDSMENGWTGEFNGNEELITEDESTFSRDGTWPRQSEDVLGGVGFGRDKSSALHIQRLEFAGYKWIVKHTDHGLELCDSRNVWVDVDGQLHLRLAAYGGKWRGASVCSEDCFGFGDYTFGVLGHLDALDPHVAFEICSFLDTSGVNAESVQVLFSRRGDAEELPGEYVVQPSLFASEKTAWFQKFDFRLEKQVGHVAASYHSAQRLVPPLSVHRIHRDGRRVVFSSRQKTDRSMVKFAGNVFKPKDADALVKIPQQPMPVHFRLFSSIPPTDGREVEIVVTSFEFSSE